MNRRPARDGSPPRSQHSRPTTYGSDDRHDRGPAILEASDAHVIGVESPHTVSDHPRRIQRRRVRGWRLPPNTIYVGRGTKWGPPWVPAHFWWATDRAQACVEAYRYTVVRHLYRNPDWLAPLQGKHLACYCALDQPCHADVLLELANR